MSDQQNQDQAAAHAIILDEFEVKLADAAARGDNDKLAALTEEYNAERERVYREQQEKDNPKEPEQQQQQPVSSPPVPPTQQ